MDCFAALAMTEKCCSTTRSSSPAKAGDPVRRDLSVQSMLSLGYWITRPSAQLRTRRVMTTEYDFAISQRNSPEVCYRTSRPLVGRAQGRPGACCTRGLACDLRKQKGTRAYRAAGTLRPSLRNGFTAYFVLSSENGSFASVAHETNPADLAPAPRRPNHTTSPYASGAYVYRAIHVHRISPRVRDDRERPSSAVRQAEQSRA